MVSTDERFNVEYGPVVFHIHVLLSSTPLILPFPSFPILSSLFFLSSPSLPPALPLTSPITSPFSASSSSRRRWQFSQTLISHDVQNNSFNYKSTYSVEIVPVCKDEVVCLPKKLAQSLGNMGQIGITLAIVRRGS